ncbi:MAG: tRNA (adenosine(37)-N6)-threonylcarbamoyltransferase complex dimerization subunit type 1 TsaB [Clostridiales bacterium]|nr:tRNA (adenosine(37)-N6)-threonylcarbamoyltransferase complex dimerization subunit type 1 TsaB [Clostridiales bacterium]
MLILAFETASKLASAAIRRDDALLCESVAAATRTHSETLMPMADELMASAGVSPADIEAVAVDHGPGSFTGVRIGVCLANAFGMAQNIPVVGVTSLRVLNRRFAFLGLPVCAIIDARNENVYAALYQNGTETLAPQAIQIDALLSQMPVGALFTGDGAQVYEEKIAQAVQDAIVAPAHCGLLRAGAVAGVAAQTLRMRPDFTLYKEARPLYLRPSQAERLYKAPQEV